MNSQSKFTQGLGVLFTVILVGVAGYLVWLVVAKLLSFLESADSSVSAAIVGAMATVLVGVGGVLYTQAQIKKREIEEAHRSKKVEIYKRFLDMVARIMAEENPNVSLKAPTQQELVDFLVEFKTDIILWGSPKVIKAQLKFEKTFDTGGNVLFSVDELYKAIREDIGLSNRGLDNHQLMKMYLKNPDELDDESASNKALQRTSR